MPRIPTMPMPAIKMAKPTLIVLCAVAVLGCGISKDKYAAKELEASQAAKKLQDETAKVADLEAKLTASRNDVAEVTEEKGKLEAKSAQYEQLAQSLQGQISAGQIELSELKGKMMVKLKDKILFSSGSAKIGREGKVALDAVAEAFKDLKGKNVIVAGYTDDVPIGKSGYHDNWDLSSARAASVVRHLASKGINPQTLGAAGFSEYRPLASNDTPEGRSQNRRIEIALTAADYTPPVEDVSKGQADQGESK